MSSTGIDVYIPERGGEGDDSGPFKKELQTEFASSFHFVSIGRGTASAAWVTELVSFDEICESYAVGLIVLAFFAGEKIEKGLKVWPALYKRLKSTFHHEPTFDREGAAILVVNEITERLGEELIYVRCNGFQVIDRVIHGDPINIPAPMAISTIGPRQIDMVSNRDVYYFDVEANYRRRFLGRVEFDKVTIRDIDNIK